jgi:hypothetical protein
MYKIAFLGFFLRICDSFFEFAFFASIFAFEKAFKEVSLENKYILNVLIQIVC